METLQLLDYAIAFFTLFVTNVFILMFLRYRDVYMKKPEAGSVGKPAVSVVIAAHNEKEHIAKCIESILAVDYPREKLEVIVVDDGSTDGTLAVAKSYEKDGVRVLAKKQGGKSSALNLGIGKARGEFVATMDADSYVTPGTMRELLPYFSDPDVMAVTPAIKIRPSGSWIKEIQRVEYLLILFSRKLLNFIDSVPVTPGPFSMFRAKVFSEIGGFSEKSIVEDMEIALRIQSRHYKIRSSMTAEVYTEPPATFGELVRQRVRWQRGGFRNYWDYRGMMAPAYGDFGMYFIPLNWMSIFALFLIVGMMTYSMFTAPYYVKYIWLDSLGMGISLFTIVAVFVAAVSIAFLFLAVRSFRNEAVKLRYMAGFLIAYWYLMVLYNLLFIWKEARKEPAKW